MNPLALTPPIYVLAISEIAAFLDLHKSTIEQMAERYQWQPTGERVQGGGDKYNIDNIRFYKKDEKNNAARQKIKNNIRAGADKTRKDAEAAAIAARLAKIKEQTHLEDLAAAELPLNQDDREDLWRQMSKKNLKQKQKAIERAHAVTRFQNLRHEGLSERDATKMIALDLGKHPNSIRKWVSKTKTVHPSDRAAVLVCQNFGQHTETEFTPAAWEFIKKDYLRPGGRTLAAVHRDAVAAGKSQGWVIPSLRTVENWVKRKIDPMVIKLRREGMEAVEKCFPAMKRNKEMFDVLQAVNGDGYQFGLWVDFGNGVIEKPKAWFWQDIRSSKMLSWRVDVSENSEQIRLSILDLITDWGIPEFIYLDNTRAATAKQISGRIPNRYRFKNKETDPQGVIPKLGSVLCYTLPAHGQSKPIERAFGIGGMGDFDTWPVFVNRGTKSRPIPIEEFESELKSFVAEWNARPDRRGDAVKGKSFNQVFNELYPQAIITKATEKQRTYCMCSVEVVNVSKTDASIALKAGRATFGDNRYWNEALTRYMGKQVTVRFDPANLHSGVWVETLDGIEICVAEPNATGGFRDVESGREVNRAKNSFKKRVRLMDEGQATLTAAEARAQMPRFEEQPTAAAKITRIAATVPSKGKAAAVAVDQERPAAVQPIKSGMELFAQAKKTAAPQEMTQEEIDGAFMRGVAKMTGFKKAI